ncbi:hypothetical protein LTR48_005676 [Friedmanniomyces endolithicus]|uniref:Nucleoside phosphorylase domain-containing protein n=1 Tax=Rachicladosporium monterosium TaxID=1507873 RepID=A0ABR0L1F8_9PEZI|nr:hypothetical protein LTR29_007552 [Friedmanniomyces endolithicus]KAK1084189.1 hypothetical protein LTR48_005676 [Friedmanniomyces endolithicus]KAK5142008.1 hypothetical protein LTR32_005566 [Rachicladosporium monterosium]
MAETPLRRLRSCALAIFCGKPEEITIIATELGARERISGTAVDGVDNGHIFHIGKMEFVGGKKLGFYVTSSLRQGLVPFAIATGALISVLRPRFAIHAGVCAGNKKQGVRLMDVVCGDSAMSLEDGKWALKNDTLTFLPDYETVSSPVAGLIPFASTRPNVHYGFYVSGSAVREDAPAIFEKIELTITRKVLALEMEASAFLKLCSHSKHTNVLALGVLKGVSDLGDEDRGKDPEVYEEALRETGRVLKDWVCNCFSSMTWEPSEEAEPGAKLARTYYTNFVQRVVDALSAGVPVIVEAIQEDSTAPASRPTAVKIVMPPDDNVDYFAEQGQLEEIAGTYALQNAVVGQKSFKRTAYCKGENLVDFPRCLNGLCDTDEPASQALVFRRFLEARPYFRRIEGRDAPSQVLRWGEFVQVSAGS